MGLTTGVPGEASDREVPAEQMHADYNPGTGQVDMTYTAACDAADHTIYYGDLSNVSSHGYSDAACFVGTSGTASFDPGSGSWFFLVVASNGSEEGSFGKDSTVVERPEAVGVGICDVPQNLAGVTFPEENFVFTGHFERLIAPLLRGKDV